MDFTLQTKRLLMRKIQVEDKDYLLRMYQNPLVNATYICDSLQTDEAVTKFVERMSNFEYDGKTYLWILEYEGRPIGMLNTFLSHDDSSTIEIGYAVDSPYWNQGFATEALVAAIDYLLKNTEYHKIQCSHFLSNVASKRVMEKANMIYEGVRQEVFFFRGEYHSLGYYYVIRK